MMSRQSLLAAAMLATAAALGGCGGAGVDSIASAPPPVPTPAPTPPPPTTSSPIAVVERESVTSIMSPATRAATHDTIALIDGQGSSGAEIYKTSAPGEVRIKTDPASGQYTLLFAANEIPVASSRHEFQPQNFNHLWDGTIFGNINSIIQEYSDGSTKITQVDEYRRGESTIETANGSSTKLRQTLVYDVGMSYVAFGEWAWRTIRILANGDEAIGPSIGRVFFVNGDRTPASAIPASGTATYTAASLGYDTDAGNGDFLGFGASIDILLTADFGQRSISAQLDRDYSVTGDAVGGYLTALGMDLQGTGPIGSPGDFSIPLSGSLMTDSTRSQVSGSLSGAFFGPNAEQVGGVFAIGEEPGHPVVRDVFVGARAGQ